MKSGLLWPEMTIEEEIGYGSYGTVYRVLRNGESCALKIIRLPGSPQEAQELLCRLGSRENVREYCAQAAEELLQEIRILQKFRDNPHIVSVLDYRMEEISEDGDIPGIRIGILMELLEPFTEYEISHQTEEKDAVRLGMDICDALSSCEREGIIHRDLKPENILAAEDGTFKLGDFGVARNPDMTHSRSLLKGTFSYMAPEVYHGGKYDHRADIYSLGIVLYRMVNQGREPFVPLQKRMISQKEKEEALNRRMNGEAIPAPAGASPEFAQILQKACAFYPEKRYADAAQFKAALLQLQKGTYRRRRQNVSGYGKRTARDHLKMGVMGALAGLAVFTLARVADGIYQERFANYCDQGIRKEIEEEYGVTLRSRLSGTGVLYLYGNEDLYCTKIEEKYPWMYQKKRIKRIVFGEDLNEIPDYSGIIVERKTGDAVVSEEIFRNCENLREIDILGSSLHIGTAGSFLGAPALEKIFCSIDADVVCGSDLFSDNPWLRQDGCIMLGSKLYKYNGTKEVIDDIPEETVYIGENAFNKHEEIRKIVVPEGVRVLEDGAFAGCTGLEEVSLPDTLTRIQHGVFFECTSLEHLILPKGLTEELFAYSFDGCTSLKELEVEEGNPAYVMENGVLYNMDQTELIWASPAVEGAFTVPDSVSRIQNHAFAESDAMTELVIPDSVTEIGEYLFEENPSLIRLTIPETNVRYKMVGPLLCSKDGKELFFCLRNAAGCLIVPDGTQVIQESAFAFCSGITEIVFPETLQFIMSTALQSCRSLTAITLPHSVGFIGTRAFAGCLALESLVYEGTREEWETMTQRFDLGLSEGITDVRFAAE